MLPEKLASPSPQSSASSLAVNVILFKVRGGFGPMTYRVETLEDVSAGLAAALSGQVLPAADRLGHTGDVKRGSQYLQKGAFPRSDVALQ